MVDSNIVFAGLLRDGPTRRLLTDPPATLLSPDWMLVEVRKYVEEIARRSTLTVPEVQFLLELLTEHIEVVPANEYRLFLDNATAMIGDRDPGDVPFLALALARRCDAIWTQKIRDFAGANIPSWTTREMIKRLGAPESP